ncbi:MATE family efflux transporter [Actinomadura darangshiensis]|nr:MATE family efflux transporter [Actinomadura darangshiensis]
MEQVRKEYRPRHKRHGREGLVSRPWQIAGMAAPMAFAQLLSVLVPISIVAIMGWMSDEAIHVRALYTPLFLLFFAVQTAFDISNQSLTALRAGRGEKDQVSAMLSLGGVWVSAGVVLAGVLSMAAPALADVLGAGPDVRGPFVLFLRWMSVANLALIWPVLCASTLRGTKRASQGSAVMLVCNVVEVGGLAGFGLGTDMGLVAVPLATIIAGGVSGLTGHILLLRAGLLHPPPGGLWRPEVLGHLLRTGLPVSLSTTVMFGMNFAFLLMLEPFGADVRAGFTTAGTIQNLVLMPGFVIGSASAILMNQQRGVGGRRRLTSVLASGLQVTLIVYCVLVPVLWLLRDSIGHLATGNPRIVEEIGGYFAIVGPSYLTLGLVYTSVMALQQTGGGVVALSGNAIYVLGTVGIGALAVHGAASPTPLYVTMSAMNVCGLVVVISAFVFLGRQDRRRHAHPGSAQAR